jgi:hypothetical protein
VTRYEWVQLGGSHTFPMPPPSQLVFNTPVPEHGIAVKRIVARGFAVFGATAGTHAADIGPAALTLEVWVGGDDSGGGTLRMRHTMQFQMSNFVHDVEGVDIYNAWWGIGAGQDGFDEPLLAGSVHDAAYTHVQVLAILEVGADWQSPMGFDWEGVIRVLYAYPG